MLFDKNGSCHHPFFRMLHPGYIVQQEKTNGGSADDPKDMGLHVDDRNGTSVVILDNRKIEKLSLLRWINRKVAVFLLS